MPHLGWETERAYFEGVYTLSEAHTRDMVWQAEQC
jgi:hypothetical protein